MLEARTRTEGAGTGIPTPRKHGAVRSGSSCPGRHGATCGKGQGDREFRRSVPYRSGGGRYKVGSVGEIDMAGLGAAQIDSYRVNFGGSIGW